MDFIDFHPGGAREVWHVSVGRSQLGPGAKRREWMGMGEWDYYS